MKARFKPAKSSRQEMQVLSGELITRTLSRSLTRIPGQAFIVMEFVERTSLDQIIKDNPALPNEQIALMGMPVCRGLDFAHAQRVIHRDIKLANILLSTCLKTLKITEFGIARLDDSAMTKTTQCWERSTICPRRRFRESPWMAVPIFSPRVALLYEILTKQKAFRGGTLMNVLRQVIFTTPPALSLKERHVSESLIRVVMKAREKEAGKRFASDATMADALERSLEKDALPGSDDHGTSGSEADSEMTQTAYEAVKINLETLACKLSFKLEVRQNVYFCKGLEVF